MSINNFRSLNMNSYNYEQNEAIEAIAREISFPQNAKLQMSLNSYDMSNENEFKAHVRRKLIDESIDLPPTKKSLNNLFKHLNLKVPPVTVLECLITTRGPKMEEEEREKFRLEKLMDWLWRTLPTLKHRDEKVVDKNWLRNKRASKSMQGSNLPLGPWKPNPQSFMRKGTGSGGGYINKLLYHKEPSVFTNQE